MQGTLNAATAKFQLALPVVLSPVSPHLAALHATRARILYPTDNTLAGTHCTRCGTPFLTAGGGSIRSIRKKRRKNNRPGSNNVALVRVLRRSCRACGFDDDVPIDPATAPAFPKVRDRARRKSSAAPPAARAQGAASVKPAAVPAPAQHAPVSQPLASRSAQSPATPASSRSSSITPSSSRPSPAPVSAPASAGSSMKPAQAVTSQQQQIASHAKSRPKKKAGLQSLLARNREKQEAEKKRAENQGQGGLSAFLQGL
ncbi:hypothetical protein PYCCODRAFT_1466204 [Trametes coccinea BRFM310]|uniref:Rpr2-domain-containing protein n=1 Tax=Trametes coccinea (strain BRFM310) TaxID=1353009 RepID=A0A1Y2IUD3_TRAC3|nr:hypothetical protein PYCCODRAFT_1466204 [Trametes coccinea BRFM310]